MRVNGLIVAAGDGRRIGKDTSKALLPLAGRPMLLHTLDRFSASETVRRVIVVVKESETGSCRELILSDAGLRNLQCVLQPGGLRRQDSVRQGLERLDPDCEVVVIHDGARPFVLPHLIDRCAELASREGSVVVGVPVRNTIKVVSADRRVRETLPRDSLWEIQTPQAFRVEIIRDAHLQAIRDGAEATDDAMLVERLGNKVFVLEGQTTNIKVTFQEDLRYAEALLDEGKRPYRPA